MTIHSRLRQSNHARARPDRRSNRAPAPPRSAPATSASSAPARTDLANSRRESSRIARSLAHSETPRRRSSAVDRAPQCARSRKLASTGRRLNSSSAVRIAIRSPINAGAPLERIHLPPLEGSCRKTMPAAASSAALVPRGETRTPDLRFRKPLLCPAELPGLGAEIAEGCGPGASGGIESPDQGQIRGIRASIGARSAP